MAAAAAMQPAMIVPCYRPGWICLAHRQDSGAHMFLSQEAPRAIDTGIPIMSTVIYTPGDRVATVTIRAKTRGARILRANNQLEGMLA